jgi:hypothetical protein
MNPGMKQLAGLSLAESGKNFIETGKNRKR